MADMVHARVRVDKYMEGDSIRYGVPVRFRPVIDDSRGLRRTDVDRPIVTAVAPVSDDVRDGANVSLLAGEYDVEAVLPSGEPLSEEVRFIGGAEFGQNQQVVVLRSEHSPNEWRSWAHYASATVPAHREQALMHAKGLSPAADLTVSIGTTVKAAGFRSFNPSRWEAWFDFLEARHHARSDQGPLMRLSGADKGLRFETEGGRDGAPLRIKFIADRRSYYSPGRTIGSGDRTYAAINGASGTRLIALPWPWAENYDHPLGNFFEILAIADRNELRCDAVLRDTRWAGLFAYMNQGRMDLASEILNSARDALFGKFENPLAATVGGYVLLSGAQQSDDGDVWPDWLENLRRYFPYLPDGPVLRARWLLRQNSEEHAEQARALLHSAFRRGIPYFTTGVTWLIEGLEQAAPYDERSAEMLRIVRGVARTMDLGQVFTSFSLGRPQSGELAAPRLEYGGAPGIALDEAHWGASGAPSLIDEHDYDYAPPIPLRPLENG